MSRLEGAMEENEQLEIRAVEAENRAKKLQNKVTEKEMEIDAVKEQIDRLRAEYDAVIGRERENRQKSDSDLTKRHAREMAAIKAQLTEKSEQLVGMQKQLVATKTELDREKASVRQLQDNVRQMRNNETRLEEETARLKTEIFDMKKEIGAGREELENRLEMAQLAAATSQAELETIKKNVREISDERDELMDELGQLRRAELKVRADLESARALETKSIAGAQLKTQELELENAGFRRRVVTLEDELATRDDELRRAKAKCANLTTSVGEQERQIGALEAELAKVEQGQSEQIEMLEAERENLQLEVEKKDADRIQMEKAELRTRSKLEEMKTEFELLRVQNDEEQLEVTRVKSELARVKLERDEIEGRLVELDTERKRRLDERGEVENELDEMREKFAAEAEIWTARNNQLETELAEACEQLDHVRQENEQGRQIQADIAQQLCDKQSEMERQNGQRTNREEDLKALVRELESEKEGLNQVVRQLEDEIEERDEKDRRYEMEVAQMEQKRAEMEQEVISYRAKTKQVEAKLNLRAKDEDHLRAELETIEAEHARQIDKLGQENELLKQQNHDVTRKLKRLKAENEDFKAAENEIADSIDSRDSQIAKLAAKFKAERKKCDEMESEMETIQSKYDEIVRSFNADRHQSVEKYKQTEKVKKGNCICIPFVSNVMSRIKIRRK